MVSQTQMKTKNECKKLLIKNNSLDEENYNYENKSNHNTNSENDISYIHSKYF